MTRTLLTIILILASVALIFWVDRPLWAELGGVRSEAKNVSEALGALKDLETLRENILQTYDSIPPSKLSRLAELLPAKSDVGSMLINLEKLTKDRGLRLRRVDFAKEETTLAQAAQAQAGRALAIGKEEKGFAPITYTFTVSATYENFRSLLSALEKNLRIIDVSDIAFTGGDGLLEFTIKAKSYSQKPAPEAKTASSLELVDRLKKISIDTSFFEDESFLNLESSPKPSLEGIQKGRPNPFIPAGRR